MQIIIKGGDVYCLSHKKGSPHPLPNTKKIAIQRRENWNFPTSDQPAPLNTDNATGGLPSFSSHPTYTSSQSDSFSHVYHYVFAISFERHRQGGIWPQLQQ